MQQESFFYEKQLLDLGKKVVAGPCRNFGLEYDQLGVIRCTSFYKSFSYTRPNILNFYTHVSSHIIL